MTRDYDIREGLDGRDDAKEHVIFSNPSKLFGKRIGMACYNFTQNSGEPTNKFKMALVNRHGQQLEPKGTELKHEPWMVCPPSNKSRSE